MVWEEKVGGDMAGSSAESDRGVEPKDMLGWIDEMA